MYPLKRNRRLRSKKSLRNLVRETTIHPHDFIVPLFLVEGKNIKEEISSMPNYYRFSLDNICKEVKQLWDLGVQAVLLFAKVPENLKDNYGTEALNPDGLMQRGIKEIKACVPEITIMTDVALDPYSNFGHDGIVENNEIINDKTNEILSGMALSHAEAGVDVVAPSDMMDGRILSIRKTLEKSGFHNIGIMSYAVKYASNFYGPFRNALDSKPGFGDKQTYQMDFSNRFDSVSEAKADIEEGADIIMVKPCFFNNRFCSSNKTFIFVSNSIFLGVDTVLSLGSSACLFNLLINFTTIKIVKPTIKKSNNVSTNDP